jgi:hypothetical protein
MVYIRANNCKINPNRAKLWKVVKVRTVYDTSKIRGPYAYLIKHHAMKVYVRVEI